MSSKSGPEKFILMGFIEIILFYREKIKMNLFLAPIDLTPCFTGSSVVDVLMNWREFGSLFNKMNKMKRDKSRRNLVNNLIEDLLYFGKHFNSSSKFMVF